MIDPMVAAKQEEDNLLKLANENGKFGLAVDLKLPIRSQQALERMQLSGRVRLIDVSPLANAEGIFRIFKVEK